MAFLYVCFAALLLTTVLGAPLNTENKVEKRSADARVAEVQTQDNDLQDLLSLVNKQTHQDDVMVHQEHVTHFENNNGQKVQIDEKEEKVVDTKSGDVIADVKQEVKQGGSDNEAAPETVVETEVDIPAEGVHETFVQEGEENSSDTDETDSDLEEVSDSDIEPELTPADMAEYLYVTQQFDAFYSAIDRLVNQSKMDANDAEMYVKTVALEYEKLQLEDFEDRFLTEKRFYPQVPQLSDAYAQPAMPDVYPQPGPAYSAEERFPLMDYYGYPAAFSNPEEQYMPQQPDQSAFDADIDPYEFLAALWNQAYGEGNEEAQEIVKMLYDRVSQDDNPDDMGQIRDILIDTVAASLNESPYNYQPMEMQGMGVPQVPQGLANQQLPVQMGEEQKRSENEAVVADIEEEGDNANDENDETDKSEEKEEEKEEEKTETKTESEDKTDEQKQ